MKVGWQSEAGRGREAPRDVTEGMLGPWQTDGTATLGMGVRSHVHHEADAPMWVDSQFPSTLHVSVLCQVLPTLTPTNSSHSSGIHPLTGRSLRVKGEEQEASPCTVLLSDLGFVPCLSELICEGAGRGDPLALSRHHRSTAGKACSLPFPALAPMVTVCPPQFRSFREVTLTHLQAIASNYNLSFNIDARFQSLAQESQAVALVVNQSQAAVQGDLGHLKTWMKKTQRRSRKVDSRLLALSTALSERSQQHTQERKEQEAQREALSSLVLDVRALQDTLAHLMHVVQSQGARLASLKGWLQVAGLGTEDPVWPPAQPGPPSPSSPKLHGARQVLRALPEPRDPPQDFAGRLQGSQEPPDLGSQRAQPPETPGESKYCGTVLRPSASISPSHSSLGLQSPPKSCLLGAMWRGYWLHTLHTAPKRKGPSR